MSFADSMEDLEAMNDPRNTAESVAARHAAKKQSRRFQALLARLLSLKAWRKYQTPHER